MNEYADEVRERLLGIIGEMAKAPGAYVRTPGKDFTRNRKISFEAVMRTVLAMGGNSNTKELLEAYDYRAAMPTSSAFMQQRAKLLPEAFEHLFHEFTQANGSDMKTYLGYRLIAFDGSDLHTPTDPGDPDTHFNCNPLGNGHNLYHLNAAYDLCNRLYLDAVLQPRRLLNEAKAMVDMVDRSTIAGNVIVTADRGYESYNILAHVAQKGWHFLIRIKHQGTRCILHGLRLPSTGQFDISTSRIFTRRKSREIRDNPDLYKIVDGGSASFDFIDNDHPFFHMHLRVVRFKLPNGSFETLITNLPPSDFPTDQLKMLYFLRWGIETSFRSLKHTVALSSFHSKKQVFIRQELFARLTMYNFAESLASHVVFSQPLDAKYLYQLDFSVTLFSSRRFLRFTNPSSAFDIVSVIRKHIIPIRPDRHRPRNIRPQSAVSFHYRVA